MAVERTIVGEEVICEIWQDDYEDSPRDWDNLGTLVASHRNYTLGDRQDVETCVKEMLEVVKGSTDKAEVYFNNHTLGRNLERCRDKFIIMPVYMFEHSGVCLSTTPFSCPWDSGQVGFIYVSKKKVREEYNIKNMTIKVVQKVKEVLNSEIEVYSSYLAGEVYGLTLYHKDSEYEEGNEYLGEEYESCGGFYGSDFKENGMADYLPEDIIEKL